MILEDLTFIGYFRFAINLENPLEGSIGLDLDPKVHGKGLSKKLYLLFINNIVKSLGVKHLTLRVLKTNKVALSLYGSIGMEVDEATTIDYAMSSSVVNLVKVLEK